VVVNLALPLEKLIWVSVALWLLEYDSALTLTQQHFLNDFLVIKILAVKKVLLNWVVINITLVSSSKGLMTLVEVSKKLSDVP